jgi:predicted GH43/DUF377 family glycosyl hydrolase
VAIACVRRATDTARMSPRRIVLLLVVLIALAATGGAGAFSQDDSTYYETFLDMSGLQPLTNTALDAQGGLRLATNGAPAVSTWNTDSDFATGVTYQSLLFGPVGVSTLATSGTGTAAALTLPATALPLTTDGADPVLSPTAATVGDGDNVDDPTLVKVGSAYDMWYTGTAEDGSAPAIFLATSSDGTTWTRANGNAAVLQGTPGAFDANGVSGADVVYDASDLVAPYKMWYSGQSGVFGGIGYATSTDGIAWTKYTAGGLLPVPVLDHGAPGSADSFSAADPSVLKDGSTWKMWYTGDDSNKKRIAYATSPDGVSWTKGGKVLSPEDPGASANIAFGAFAPTVWKTNSGFSMLLTGRKIVGGGVFATKIMQSTSTDGLTWTAPSPALNPSGVNTGFDYSNLNSPDLLYDPLAAKPYELYHSGNTIDDNGNFHTRIGLATSSDGNSFNKVSGPLTGNSVLDVGTPGTAFDARQASGVSATEPGGSGAKFVGFYWGTRGSDFMPRLGEATSPDGSVWTKVAGAGTGGAILSLPGGSKFDSGGERDPGVLFDSTAYDLYFTALSSAGTESIGSTSTAALAGTNEPDNANWTTATQVLAPGGAGFDSSGVSHPSVIKDAATYVMYFTGDASGTLSIGRATSATAGGAFTGDTQVLALGAAGTFDAAGVKDPIVVEVAAGDYRMLYTGVDSDGIERVGYATSTDGSAWTKQGLVLNPSLTPFAADEVGVEPTGMLVDGGTSVHVWTNGIDRTGRTRGDHTTTTLGLVGTTPSGWATYQLGDSTTTIEDFRQIARTSSGDVTLFVSCLQPYSSAGSEFWSEYFPVTLSSPSEALNFLLTVHGIRWRAQLATPATTPSLDNVQVTEAPVSLATTGSASTNPIQAAPGRLITAWGSLAIDTSILQPSGGGTGSGTVSVVDAGTSAQLATSALTTSGQTTIDLSAVDPVAHPSISIVFSLTGSGDATPLVQSLTLTYTSQPAPITLTITAAPTTVVYGKSVTLNGLLTQGALALSGQTVTLAAEPFGSVAFTPFATPTTDVTGAYPTVVHPTMQTVYEASATGVVTAPTVTVHVSQLVKLGVRRKGGKVYFKGSLGPKRKGRVIVIQKRSGKRWKTIARVRTSKLSTFAKALALPLSRHGYRFRAKTSAYPGLLAGTSHTVKLRK